jgi:2-(1,2-epoxy-1,2-dihydrophenyl)acetyl-CoA isomerase
MVEQDPHLETQRDGAVIIVRLDNERSRNSLSRELHLSLRKAVREIEDDPTIRAVYLTAKGPTFCAGGDLNMLIKANEPWSAHRRGRFDRTLLSALMSLDRPVVCGVRGHAIGGGFGLALHSDVVIAGESSRFMTAFYRLGVIPDFLTLFTLPRMIGLARARHLLLTGGMLTGQEAFDLGIAAKVVPDDQVDVEGVALAHSLAAGPAEVIGLAKLLLLRSFESSLDELMLYENLAQALAMSSAEFKEGVAALRENRKPAVASSIDKS